MPSRKTAACVGSLALTGAVLAGLVAAPAPAAAQAASPRPATFSKDVAPILQRSCENCHRAGGGAPMPLVTYPEVRPWARAIKARTAAREMPPWFIDKNIGIQRFKDDPSLSGAEIATLAAWADAGAPRGDPADLPPPREWADRGKWSIGTPDLVISSPVSTVAALAPDWYGMVNPPSPTGLTEDRWIKAVEIREAIVDDDGREVVPAAAGAAGGESRADLNRFVVHHSVINAKRNSAPEDDAHPEQRRRKRRSRPRAGPVRHRPRAGPERHRVPGLRRRQAARRLGADVHEHPPAFDRQAGARARRTRRSSSIPRATSRSTCRRAGRSRAGSNWSSTSRRATTTSCATGSSASPAR